VKQIELSAGTIEYSDTGGDRPVLVLLHGLMMDASLWDGPMADLSADHRCVAPTLPLGAHRHAMRADADLSLPGIARLIAEFLDRLDLQDVTLVGNDTGGALVQLLMCHRRPRADLGTSLAGPGRSRSGGTGPCNAANPTATSTRTTGRGRPRR
jgi:pimeloyl-ACP methyl ester carboxylesterase